MMADTVYEAGRKILLKAIVEPERYLDTEAGLIEIEAMAGVIDQLRERYKERGRNQADADGLVHQNAGIVAMAIRCGIRAGIKYVGKIQERAAQEDAIYLNSWGSDKPIRTNVPGERWVGKAPVPGTLTE